MNATFRKTPIEEQAEHRDIVRRAIDGSVFAYQCIFYDDDVEALGRVEAFAREQFASTYIIGPIFNTLMVYLPSEKDVAVLRLFVGSCPEFFDKK